MTRNDMKDMVSGGCGKCDSFDHMANDCPNTPPASERKKDETGSGTFKECKTCHKPSCRCEGNKHVKPENFCHGHRKKDCPNGTRKTLTDNGLPPLEHNGHVPEQGGEKSREEVAEELAVRMYALVESRKHKDELHCGCFAFGVYEFKKEVAKAILTERRAKELAVKEAERRGGEKVVKAVEKAKCNNIRHKEQAKDDGLCTWCEDFINAARNSIT